MSNVLSNPSSFLYCMIKNTVTNDKSNLSSVLFHSSRENAFKNVSGFKSEEWWGQCFYTILVCKKKECSSHSVKLSSGPWHLILTQKWRAKSPFKNTILEYVFDIFKFLKGIYKSTHLSVLNLKLYSDISQTFIIFWPVLSRKSDHSGPS